jgi:mannose/cellobiose epimerase-like protein (N-acyl-D-glucosamine 2-epimerase family)
MADGWDDEHGGLCYTTGWDGRPVVREHFHWVVCEGIAAAAALSRVTGEQRFADGYARLWEYARTIFISPGAPGWLHEANPDGSPSAVTWTGRPDVYHAVQAALVPLLPLAPVFAGSLASR